ncbi:MAG TPA: hypothetical protein VFW65_06410 [Pseudonocardiaceae bacterium]|nr:hypothetical protein [Pseudonocardiaceae bacterium]
MTQPGRTATTGSASASGISVRRPVVLMAIVFFPNASWYQR